MQRSCGQPYSGRERHIKAPTSLEQSSLGIAKQNQEAYLHNTGQLNLNEHLP